MTTEALYQIFLKHPSVSTDSRNIPKDGIFFALKGPNFNGNAFALEALEKGASFAVIDEKEYRVDERFILVGDVLTSLQQLGTHHRLHSGAIIISLTGSNGKTTTKELIHAVLSQKYRTIATSGNLNNHIGVPLTLLRIRENTEIAVVEMGANHQKEIEFLSSLALPDHGYITNFGKAHLEGFGGVEGVIKGKSELYTNLISRNAHIFWNADDPIQDGKLKGYPNKTGFSEGAGADQKIEFQDATPLVRLKVENTEIQTNLPGKYNFPNAAIAVLMGMYFRVSVSQIKKGIEAYLPENNRSQILEKNGLKIYLDAYNANPTSMKAALEAFGQTPGKVKSVVLGDMFELGESAAEEHQAIADIAREMELEERYFVGENFFKTQVKGQKFRTFQDLSAHLEQHPLKKGSVLIKGSRGMALERTLEFL
ncbi:UDP-N-acetylmuramoyl-tripeptide--D-alanyl-D-alanine ligase [Muriicola jejuensis]|uniref:UDP-N-acetylmuramoyl-tripeptide--D-alanyl-D-alanine ligase n=1 Tax=Muriicola jejuensis TaxID=504488 RepID=A0A6P0UEZ6_9FLAO|nr:UDP-N-acetylmuramoyl-tripeptide--D-alanyl-D-alanine ligase [Muriicola jejuensis]NER10459.1 UDP-N-acetylmuramoyl-tripeptide--D-alanyl-D-alanine ligase [Muriicola jejuensis]SMP18617.1 UDP-N-acetylmuramoyl-tripeptide--D-alanyl-D-alanine ligase [Muriicola jejuensis]